MAVCLIGFSLHAQEKSLSPWFIGIEGGVPFSASSFSSFGENKTNFGFEAGISGGYYLNNFLSIELSALVGETNMSNSLCCSNYYLDLNGNRHLVPISNSEYTVSYRDLKSELSLIQSRILFNFDMIRVFRKGYNGNFSVLLSPTFGFANTKANVISTIDNRTIITGESLSHISAGAQISFTYNINDKLGLRLSSGATYLNGDQFDGLPSHDDHKDSYVWNNTLGLTFRFGKSAKAENARLARLEAVERARLEAERLKEQAIRDSIMAAENALAEQARMEAEEKAKILAAERAREYKVGKPEGDNIIYTTNDGIEVEFPTIFFDFNVVWIPWLEREKADEIVRLLYLHDDLKIEIVGHADFIGGDEINKKVSLQRAEALKSWCVERGISSSRIKVVGAGIDYNPEREKARRSGSSTIKE